MKKILTGIIIGVILCIGISTVAETANKLFVNDVEYSLEYSPVFQNGQTYISQEDVSRIFNKDINVKADLIQIESVMLMLNPQYLRVDANVTNTGTETVSIKVRARLYDSEGNNTISLSQNIRDLKPGETKYFIGALRYSGIVSHKMEYEILDESKEIW